MNAVTSQCWKRFFSFQRIALRLFILILVCAANNQWLEGHEGVIFIEKPYIQLGYFPWLSKNGQQLVVTWQTPDRSLAFDAQLRTKDSNDWISADSISARRVAVSNLNPFRIYTATFKNLKAGSQLTYRVLLDKKLVFSANTQTIKAPEQPYRFTVFGDTGANTSAQRRIAYQAYKLKPDFVMIPGDIVYPSGRISEYRNNFFPVFNADQVSVNSGVPFMSTTLFTAAFGNHDLDFGPGLFSDFNSCPDALAYFLIWQQPLNGPIATVGALNAPKIIGNERKKKDFLTACNSAFPRMTNFSFNYGNSHWLVLDSNFHANWKDAKLRDWINKDLTSAQQYIWKFVVFHHPGFCSDRMFVSDTRMRVLCDLFERGGVDIVFNGHAHNYQRTFPLLLRHSNQKVGVKANIPSSELIFDKKFDGKTHTKPHGITYIVTGGGGAPLISVWQHRQPWTWEPFTAKYVSNVHSFTACDVNDRTVVLKQISEDGLEIERLTFTK